MMKILALLTALLLWAAAPAAAQVTFDAKNSTSAPCATSGVCNQTGGTSLTFTHVMGSVSNGALAVMVIFGNSAIPASLAVTYNSVAMTKVTATDTGSNGGCSCWGAVYVALAPASGSHSVAITWTGTLEAHATSVSFSGVDQGSVATSFPHGTFAVQNTATASPATVAVTSATNNAVIAYSTEQSSAWGTINGTLIAKDDTTGPQLTYASNFAAGAATVNPSFAFGANSTWSIIATDVLAVGAGPPAGNRQNMIPMMGCCK